MARLTKVDRLPSEIRDAIAEQRRAGRTIDEILAHIRGLGVTTDQVSRPGLGRHIQELDDVAELARRDRAMAELLVERGLGEDDSRLARANVELMHGQVFRLSLAARRGESAEFGPKETKLMSETLRNLASAAKLDVERIEKIEKRAKEQLLKAAEAAAAEAEAGGEKLDGAAVLRKIREEVYGIYE